MTLDQGYGINPLLILISFLIPMFCVVFLKTEDDGKYDSDDYSGETLTNPTIPEKYKNVESAPVHIGKHVIIGSTSVVLPGAFLAEGSSLTSKTSPSQKPRTQHYQSQRDVGEISFLTQSNF